MCRVKAAVPLHIYTLSPRFSLLILGRRRRAEDIGSTKPPRRNVNGMRNVGTLRPSISYHSISFKCMHARVACKSSLSRILIMIKTFFLHHEQACLNGAPSIGCHLIRKINSWRTHVQSANGRADITQTNFNKQSKNSNASRTSL